MSRSLTKAAHYAVLLDEARCEGDWDAVPEFVRKVRKHAPDRVCLTLTAETEYAIEKATRNLLPAVRPGTATVPVKDLDAAAQLPKLLSVIEEENAHLQDRYQAKVCVGWLHWVVGEYELAFGRLPKSLDLEMGQSENPLSVTDWTRVCALKSAYLRANCLARNGKRREALAVFEEGLPCLTSAHTDQQTRKQLRYWSELFLTEFCMLFSHTLEQGEVSLQDSNCLVSLRSWARYWDSAKGAPLLGGHGFRGSVPRRRIWFEYYAVLSALVEDDLPYPTGCAPNTSGDASARDQLRVELKKVEATYEALLLDETAFPRADEEREEVEDFVRLVMQNWFIMKSRGWQQQDLGPGGKESMSRGVLDLLYRAATKTYHSTAILRHLFNVHLAVAEFDLAFKAFDSYLSLVKKGKARVAKTGHEEPSLDDDATVLEAVSQCIMALCRFGDRGAVEKAYHLSLELEQCLNELSHVLTEQTDEAHPRPETNFVAKTNGNDIPPRVLAASWQAVGIAHAQWARMTFDSTVRPEIQVKAVRCLRKSLSPEFGKSANLRGVFSLGLLLAEQRELSAAIDVVKGALLSNKTPDADQDRLNGPYWRERAMVPLWHLLSLLLSARQDYVMAARACEGAFEQFKDPAVLFGGETLYRSEHLNEAEANGDEKRPVSTRGIVDDMDDFEKEKILEVKMTQLALVELLENPKVAVNASSELLTLFTRLFGPVQVVEAKTQLKTSDVPRSSAGTLRSIKGSLFGRGGDRNGRPTTKHSSLGLAEKGGAAAMRPQTTQTTGSRDGPMIHVSRDGDDGRLSRRSSNNERRSQSGKRHSLRSGSRRRAASSGAVSHQSDVADGEGLFTPVDDGRDGSEVYQFSTSRRRLSSSGGPPISMSRQALQLESMTATARTRSMEAQEAGLGDIEPSWSLMPPIEFSKDYEGRRRATILVEVWLMIAGFYRRADMLDDARGAVLEAQKLVTSLDEDGSKDPGASSGVASGNSSSVSSRDAGWAGKKSIDELWADVWTETGHLSLIRDSSYAARLDFESALMHFPDHPGAIIGLSNILLDIYCEKLLPLPAIPKLELADGSVFPKGVSNSAHREGNDSNGPALLPSQPLGLVVRPKKATNTSSSAKKSILDQEDGQTTAQLDEELVPPYQAISLPLVDRLAARDRAYALLSGVTKLGSAWNNSEAWFALARAHEESGQPDKAKEALWWCVELEEAAAVRPWSSAATGNYIF